MTAQHKKLLRAKVTGLEDTSLALFEPDNHLLGVKGLSVAEAATEPDADNCVTLIMQNDTLEPTHLNKGQVLGRFYPEPRFSLPWIWHRDIGRSRSQVKGKDSICNMVWTLPICGDPLWVVLSSG